MFPIVASKLGMKNKRMLCLIFAISQIEACTQCPYTCLLRIHASHRSLQTNAPNSARLHHTFDSKRVRKQQKIGSELRPLWALMGECTSKASFSRL